MPIEPAARATGVWTPAAPGEVRQVAWIVTDIHRAMAHWSGVLGVGPWFCNEHVGITEFRYHGRDSAPPDLSIALANSGTMQLELIQQHDDHPSLYRDFLARNGEGAQHLAWWTTAFDATAARLLAAGYIEGHAGRIGQRGRFAYYVHAGMPGNVVEVSEQTGGKAEFFRQVAAAAIGWDGQDPIRKVVRR
jgi:Glyoxalase/Bleomycin resistance protein/Dioxygenase superfamily